MKIKTFKIQRIIKIKYMLFVLPLWVAFIWIIFSVNRDFPIYLNVSLSLFFSILLSLFVSFLFFSFKGKEKFDRSTFANIKKLNNQFSVRFDHFLVTQKKKRFHKSFYDEPIYFFLTQDIEKDRKLLSQMGYEQFLTLPIEDEEDNYPIEAWVSSHSIILCIEMNARLHDSYVENLCVCLNKRRKRQAINGVILSSDISYLIDNYDDLHSYTDKIRALIYQANTSFGLNIPIYNIFSGISGIEDLCQYFSVFDQTSREAPFGAMMDYNKEGGIDLDWFKNSFENLSSRLLDNLSLVIDRQLTADFKQSAAAGPFQFSLLQSYLSEFFDRLYRTDNYHQSLLFRGYFFVNTSLKSPVKDLLASIVVKELGCNQYYHSSQDNFFQPLFAQKLMSKVILVESDLVGVNSKRENAFIFGQAIYGVFCGAIWLSVIALLKFSFDYQNERELHADRILKKYKESILTSPYSIEHFSHNIPNLLLLREIKQIYDIKEPWYSLSIIPNSSIKHNIINSYNNALQSVMLPSMLYYLEQDLFVATTLMEKNDTLSHLNVFNYIVRGNETSAEKRIINDYFVKVLRNDGQNDLAVLENFSKLVLDATIFPEQDTHQHINSDLIKFSTQDVGSVGVEHLVYQRIKELPKFSRQIDLRDEFGTKFSQVYRFNKDFTGFLVPYMYTPQGFDELDLSISSPIIKRSLDAYTSVVGVVPSSVEYFRIIKEINKMYQRDYVQFWHSLASNIQINSISSTIQLRQYLDILSDTSENPLANFYQILAKYTGLISEKSSAVNIATDLVKSADDKLANKKTQKSLLAKNISNSFKDYHAIVKINSDGQSQLDNVLKQIKDTKIWLDNFYLNANPPLHAFNILSQPLPRNNPVSSLFFYAKQQQDFIKNTLQVVTLFIDSSFIKMTKNYLNDHWKTFVYKPYVQHLASFYPFSPNTKEDASINDIKEFFSTNGIFNKFIVDKLGAFKDEVNRNPYLPGLLPNSRLTLKSRLWSAIKVAKEIQNALGIKDTSIASVEFQLKGVEMDANILDFSIIENKPIFSYRHGPSFWKKQFWNGDAVSNDQLTVKVEFSSSPIVKDTYNGIWSWFRILSAHITDSNSRQSTLLFDYNGMSVKLLLKTNTKENPFNTNFFSRFKLPASI